MGDREKYGMKWNSYGGSNGSPLKGRPGRSRRQRERRRRRRHRSESEDCHENICLICHDNVKETVNDEDPGYVRIPGVTSYCFHIHCIRRWVESKLADRYYPMHPVSRIPLPMNLVRALVGDDVELPDARGATPIPADIPLPRIVSRRPDLERLRARRRAEAEEEGEEYEDVEEDDEEDEEEEEGAGEAEEQERYRFSLLERRALELETDRSNVLYELVPAVGLTGFMFFSPGSINFFTNTPEAGRSVVHVIKFNDERDTLLSDRIGGRISCLAINHNADKRTYSYIAVGDNSVELSRLTLPDAAIPFNNSTFRVQRGDGTETWALGADIARPGNRPFVGRLGEDDGPGFQTDSTRLTDVMYLEDTIEYVLLD